MAQTLLTHAQMIENLIGEFTPSEHPELYRAGFHFVADLIPVNSDLWQSDNLKAWSVGDGGRIVRGGNDTADVITSDKSLKIISVWTRFNGISNLCKEISWSDYSKGMDPDSLYYHGNSFKNPVYSISDSGVLYISPIVSIPAGGGFGPASGPVPESVSAYFRYWAYESLDFHGDTFDSYLITGDLHGFPRDAQLPAIIKSAMNILQAKMGESVHDDEDPELLQLQQAQMQQLQQWFESEISRLNVQWRPLGLEESK